MDDLISRSSPQSETKTSDSLFEALRKSERYLLDKAVETEQVTFLDQYADTHITADERQMLVSNCYLLEHISKD